MLLDVDWLPADITLIRKLGNSFDTILKFVNIYLKK